MLPLFDVVDYGCSHNYGRRQGSAWTEMDAWTLRFRHVFAALQSAGRRVPPWLITEGGLDINGDKYTSGWRGPSGPSEQQYAEECLYAAQQVGQSPEVQCYALFTALPTDWFSFEITESLWKRLEASIMTETNSSPLPLSYEWLAEARKYKIPVNPNAALNKAIVAAGQTRGGPEFYKDNAAWQWGLHESSQTWHLWRWTATEGVQHVYSEPVEG